MTARLHNVQVGTYCGRGITARFEMENLSRAAWRSAAGFAVGYHIFDPVTDTLVVDGPRTLPQADIAPGEMCQFELHLDLPPEPGRYRIFLSGMEEHSQWFYARDAEFLLVDAVVAAERVTVETFRVATLGTVRRERAVRSLRRAFTLPFVSIIRNRS